MKIIWRTVRVVLHEAAHNLVVRILAGLLAAVGALEVGGQAAELLAEAPVVEAKP